MSVEHSPGPLAALSQAGVSIWLDDLSRERLRTGSLARDVKEKSIVGVTTNPSIFAAAVAGSDHYAEQLADLKTRGVGTGEAVRMITTADVRDAADVLRPVYDQTEGVDGRVSIEVDPRFARDTKATIAEAKQLWWLVNRPNVMIKIPATPEGLPAITEVLALGISVNVTLIFSLERYAEVVDAFLEGMEQAKDNGHDLSRLTSVASFFVSRVDAEVDKRLDQAGPDSPVRGKIAIANAHLAYEHYEQVLGSQRWQALAAAGAHPQRPLWASTSTKDDAYPDTMYVDGLVTKDTVNTMPQATIDAFADHGKVPSDLSTWDTVRAHYDQAREVFAAVKAAGVDFDDVTAQLESEGVAKFVDSWNELLERVADELAA